MEPVDATSGMQCRDGAVLLAALEPGCARRGPCGARHEGRDVLGVVVNRGWEGADGACVLELAFFDHFCDVFC
jgi:hypothetical protein